MKDKGESSLGGCLSCDAAEGRFRPPQINDRFRRQGVIRRAASEGPLFEPDRPFVAAVLVGRSCPAAAIPDLYRNRSGCAVRYLSTGPTPAVGAYATTELFMLLLVVLVSH
jgi:hypothetical protein